MHGRERERKRGTENERPCAHLGNLGLIQRKREIESESERERTRERNKESNCVHSCVSREREREKERERQREREKGEKERKKDRVHSWVTWVSVTKLPRTVASSRKTFCSS